MTERLLRRKKKLPAGTGQTVGSAILCRLTLNTAKRFAYPFAPVLSRGLDVPLTAVTSLIAVNQATGILGIFAGPLADRLGYRRVMMGGLGLMVLGMLAAFFLPCYGTVLAAFFLAGLGKSIFDPAIQAYVGERVPFEKRGFVVGLLETSWAGSTLLGIPLIGLLIDRMGVRAPFFVLGISGLLGLAALAFFMARESGRRRKKGGQGFIKEFLGPLAGSRAALGALGFSFFASFASDNLFVVYGVWLERSFGLSVVALGASTIVIGVAELTGESLTAALSDRIGLSRAVVGGLCLSMLSYALLPFGKDSLPAAFSVLFATFFAFEFTFVSSLSLVTELVPGLRGTMMAAFMASAGMGRILGALTGGIAWTSGGITATASVSSAASLLALLFLLWGIRDWEPSVLPASP